MSRDLGRHGARVEDAPQRDHSTDATGLLRKPLSDAELIELRSLIDAARVRRPPISEFMKRLEACGVRVVPSLQSSGRLNGLSYVYRNQQTKGSDLGRLYTAKGLLGKGVRIESDLDRASLKKAAAYPRKHHPPIARVSREQRPASETILRDYDQLSESQKGCLRDVGRFRCIESSDLERFLYSNDGALCKRDLRELKLKHLIETKNLVVALHSKEHGRVVRTLRVVALSKNAKELLTRCDSTIRKDKQVLFHGFVKPREIAHDAAIYRMFRAERLLIEREGGRIRRIVLDYELKRELYSRLPRRGAQEPSYRRKRAEVAKQFGIKIVDGKLRLPDLRIEYESPTGDLCRVDLELATEHYRGSQMRAKESAGFKIYAESFSTPPLGGSSGRSPVYDIDYLSEMLSV